MKEVQYRLGCLKRLLGISHGQYLPDQNPESLEMDNDQLGQLVGLIDDRLNFGVKDRN